MPALTELRDGNARETAQSILDIGSNHDRVRPEEVQEGADRVRDGLGATPLTFKERSNRERTCAANWFCVPSLVPQPGF